MKPETVKSETAAVAPTDADKDKSGECEGKPKKRKTTVQLEQELMDAHKTASEKKKSKKQSENAEKGEKAVKADKPIMTKPAAARFTIWSGAGKPPMIKKVMFLFTGKKE